MKRPFILNYVGSKYDETKKEISKISINYDKIKICVEPFGGSFGFSRWLYFDKQKKDIEYHIYDIDKQLIDFYKFIKGLSYDEFQDFIDKYNNIQDDIKIKCGLGSNKKRQLSKKKLDEYCKTIEDKNIKYMVQRNTTRNQFCVTSIKKMKDMIQCYEMFKNTTFYNLDYNDIDLNKYDFDTTLFYLDPPYLACENSYYTEFKGFNNIFDYIETILKNYPSIFVHIKYPLITKFYKDYYYCDYPKLYQLRKHNVFHDVFINNLSFIV